jgi:hypothetical protein
MSRGQQTFKQNDLTKAIKGGSNRGEHAARTGTA